MLHMIVFGLFFFFVFLFFCLFVFRFRLSFILALDSKTLCLM